MNIRVATFRFHGLLLVLLAGSCGSVNSNGENATETKSLSCRSACAQGIVDNQTIQTNEGSASLASTDELYRKVLHVPARAGKGTWWRPVDRLFYRPLRTDGEAGLEWIWCAPNDFAGVAVAFVTDDRRVIETRMLCRDGMWHKQEARREGWRYSFRPMFIGPYRSPEGQNHVGRLYFPLAGEELNRHPEWSDVASGPIEENPLFREYELFHGW